MALSGRRIAVVHFSSADYILGTSILDMENLGLKPHARLWETVATHPFFVIPLLATLCLCLHYSALSGGWRYDDGQHMYFVTQHSPWQYFVLPDIIREQSWANFTPWNALFYEIGLPFFGLEPTGYYAHLLLVIGLSAAMTFFLLRLWLTPLAALIGSALFLAMPATGAIGQMLMTGHYAYGLLFSILTFYFFTRSIQEKNFNLSLLAAACYVMACLSKEVYVPIIAILIFLPISDWKTRCSYLWPSGVVTLAYTLFRWMVLTGFGGYGIPFDANIILSSSTWIHFVSSLMGSGWMWQSILSYLVIAILIAIFTKKLSINFVFLLMALTVLFLPVVPVLQLGFTKDLLRYLFFMSWALAVLLSCFIDQNKFHILLLIPVMGILGFSQHQTAKEIQNVSRIMESQSQFLIDGSTEDRLLPVNFDEVDKLDAFRKIVTLYKDHPPPLLLSDEEELFHLGEGIGSHVFHFNAQCQCIRNMGKADYQNHITRFRSQLAAGADQPISVFLKVEDQGFRKRLEWQFLGAEGTFQLYIRGFDVLILPPTGQLTFANTGLLKQELLVYVHLISPQGWIARSPLLALNPTITNYVSWSGKSAIHWPLDEPKN